MRESRAFWNSRNLHLHSIRYGIRIPGPDRGRANITELTDTKWSVERGQIRSIVQRIPSRRQWRNRGHSHVLQSWKTVLQSTGTLEHGGEVRAIFKDVEASAPARVHS